MENGLSGRRVLVVEDEFFLADDLAGALEQAGAAVAGPVSDQGEALELIAREPVDLAVIDINLHGRAGFLVADVLAGRDIPFVFATGYGGDSIPDRRAGVPRWEKPFNVSALVASLPARLRLAAGRESAE